MIPLMVAALACTIGAESNFESTVEALGERVAKTATQVAVAGEITRAAPQTAQAKATNTSMALDATQEAQSVLSSEAQQTTATAAVPILAALRTYGVDSSGGSVGWIHPPLSLEVEGYQQYDIDNEYMALIVGDFVISSDITWNTQFGTSGCGFMLRSNGDQNAPSQYLVVATRGGSGHVLLLNIAEGEFANGYDIFARGIDRSFDWQNDSTNRLTVIGRENLFQIYTNGIFLGEIDVVEPPSRPIMPPPPSPPADTSDANAVERYRRELEEHSQLVTEIQNAHQASVAKYREGIPLLDQGFVGMAAFSESGLTQCRFDNTWLWLIDQ